MTTQLRRLCAIAAVSLAAVSFLPGQAAASAISDVGDAIGDALKNPNVPNSGNNISGVDIDAANNGGTVREGKVDRASGPDSLLDPALQADHMVGGANSGITSGEIGIKNFIIRITTDMKNALITLAGILLMFAVYRLIFSKTEEEEAKKLKDTVIWATLGIVVMQSSFIFVTVLFAKDFDAQTARDFMDGVFKPMTRLIQVLASFAFVAVGFYGFYKMIGARGEEGEVTKGKTVFINAILGFMALKLIEPFIFSLYGKEKCDTVMGIFKSCEFIRDPGVTVGIIAQILNWTNGFVAIVTVLIIIYAGFLVLTGAGDDEKMKQAKGTIKYIAVGLAVLASTYILFKFFVTQDVAPTIVNG